MSDNKFYIRPLVPRDLNEMYFAFLNAFEDYPVPFKLNKEQFVRKFVEKLKIDFHLSIGAFDYDALAGFIFTSVNNYKNKLTAYNGGTGVKRAYRGHRITKQMYDYLIPLFKQKGIKQCVLEVLCNNNGAIRVYEEIGFEKIDILHCYKLKGKLKTKGKNFPNLELLRIYNPEWNKYEEFQSFPPTFLDSSSMITENLANEEIIEARIEGVTAGYAIHQPAFGRLSQLAVTPSFRKRGIGTALIDFVIRSSINKEITVINVHDEDVEMKEFLTSLGFDNQLSQYEMMIGI